MWWCIPGLPCFFFASLPLLCIIISTNWRTENSAGLGMRLHVTETAKGSRASPRSTHTSGWLRTTVYSNPIRIWICLHYPCQLVLPTACVILMLVRNVVQNDLIHLIWKHKVWDCWWYSDMTFISSCHSDKVFCFLTLRGLISVYTELKVNLGEKSLTPLNQNLYIDLHMA